MDLPIVQQQSSDTTFHSNRGQARAAMATLTPGVLVKLLQSMGSDVKPILVGEHRSPILQIIGIVPAPPPSHDAAADPLWPARGFYLQISDSSHSTYVSLSGVDAEAVLSSRPQLGQLVYIDRLLFAHPVPRASGVSIVPPGRPLPFVGTPESLVARSDSSGFLIQPASDAGPPFSLISNTIPSKDGDPRSRTVLAAKENIVNPTELAAIAPTKRRFSSPSGQKSTLKTSGGGVDARHPSPSHGSGKGKSRPSSPALGRATSRASSPGPSKCEVPSLVAAKEVNRRTSREPAIIVPSRYRQPSPSGRKGATSPAGRRGSMSPVRRLSAGLKVSPASGETNRKMVPAVEGFRVSDALSATKSIRKSWEDPSRKFNDALEMKEKSNSRNKLDQMSILRTQMAMSRRLSDASGENSSSENTTAIEKSFNNKSRTIGKAYNDPTPKITFQDQSWDDDSTFTSENIPEKLLNLVKEARRWRNVTSKAAVEALEEAWTTESLIRNLSMFTDLCSSSKSGNPLPAITQFLSIYADVVKLNSAAESLLSGDRGESQGDSVLNEQRKLFACWVNSALSATDPGIQPLLSNTEHSRTSLLDLPRTNLRKSGFLGTSANKNNGISSSHNNFARKGETSNIARALRGEMQEWFLKFMEDALDVGFFLLFEQEHPKFEGNETSCIEKVKMTAILSHLKQVNNWLDRVTKGGGLDEASTKEASEKLKKKIYGFVINHVGSELDSSVSIARS